MYAALFHSSDAIALLQRQRLYQEDGWVESRSISAQSLQGALRGGPKNQEYIYTLQCTSRQETAMVWNDQTTDQEKLYHFWQRYNFFKVNINLAEG